MKCPCCGWSDAQEQEIQRFNQELAECLRAAILDLPDKVRREIEASHPPDRGSVEFQRENFTYEQTR